jgi:multidrug efflux pump subunit AcrA (membrane-fusion protein)
MAGGDQATSGKPIAVRVGRVASEEIERRVEAVGTLLAFEEVTISAETEGRIIEVFVDLGDRVRRGQQLAVIHPEEQQYLVDQQQAQFRQALDRLGLKDENDRVKDINDVPEVRKAAADLFEAEQRYKRMRRPRRASRRRRPTTITPSARSRT